MNLKKVFGANLRRIRENAGITQSRLSEISGITEFQISRIENGIHIPREPNIEKLASILGVDSREFFRETGNNGSGSH